MKGLGAYASIQQPHKQQDLVVQYAALVKRIAYHLVNRLPASVQVDDVIQAGMIGLLEASKQYDPTQGASFETYAGIRIRGAMLDEIRRSDWTPRSVHRKARQVSEAIRAVENRLGRAARDSEVATGLGMSLEEYHQILLDSAGCRVFSLDELTAVGELETATGQGSVVEPYERLKQDGFRTALAAEIEALPERERLVLALYYDEELNLREIGQVLGVSESRVCQLHGQAALRLRARLADWLDSERSSSPA